MDERTEYLRRTYTSLRAGRRNLHGRICQYLRSPRTAKFNQESILKQEEALAELDASIDDWVNKLEQAENRRTRVRQKLLEHVAAAAILPLDNGSINEASHKLRMAMDNPSSTGPRNLSTPPRSPTKNSFHGSSCGSNSNSPSHSPQRVVAQVPSTILEQPLVEEAAALSTEPTFNQKRADIESIRIYADSDVYALLQDVENEITKMSNNAESNTAQRAKANAAEAKVAPILPNKVLSEEEHKELHRARSHELLSGLASSTATPTTTYSTNSSARPQSDTNSEASLPLSPPAPSPPAKDSPDHSGNFFLTNAVFKP